VLALYASEVGFFNEGEMKLLVELAGNIAFAIDHIEAAAKLERTTRVNAMLSGINSAIVRIRDRQALFEEVCRIAVSEGGFMLARVIELNPGGKARLAANTGTDSLHYQRLIDEYNADPGHATTLLASAVHSRQPAVSNDFANDPRVSGRAVLTKGASFALAVLPIVGGRRRAQLRAREPACSTSASCGCWSS
jgi:GAF domain-containing protein